MSMGRNFRGHFQRVKAPARLGKYSSVPGWVRVGWVKFGYVWVMFGVGLG